MVEDDLGNSRTEKEAEVKSKKQQEGELEMSMSGEKILSHSEENPCEKEDIPSTHDKEATECEVTNPLCKYSMLFGCFMLHISVKANSINVYRIKIYKKQDNDISNFVGL